MIKYGDSVLYILRKHAILIVFILCLLRYSCEIHATMFRYPVYMREKKKWENDKNHKRKGNV